MADGQTAEEEGRAWLGFGWGNYLLFGLALAAIVVGYVLLDRGSVTAAPILLVLGYVILLPAGLVLGYRKLEER